MRKSPLTPDEQTMRLAFVAVVKQLPIPMTRLAAELGISRDALFNYYSGRAKVPMRVVESLDAFLRDHTERVLRCRHSIRSLLKQASSHGKYAIYLDKSAYLKSLIDDLGGKGGAS